MSLADELKTVVRGEVEQRIEHEGEIVFIAWIFTLACLFVASFLGWWLLSKQGLTD